MDYEQGGYRLPKQTVRNDTGKPKAVLTQDQWVRLGAAVPNHHPDTTQEQHVKTYLFDQYVQDAEVEPFRLQVSPDETIVIEAPDGETVLHLEEVGSRERLQLLCGDQFGRVMELVGKKPPAVLRRLSQDMASHFAVDPARAPMGGSGASSS